MNTSFDESGYQHFLSYLMRAMKEEEQVKDLIRNACLNKVEVTDSNAETSLQKNDELYLQIQELQSENDRLHSEIKRLKNQLVLEENRHFESEQDLKEIKKHNQILSEQLHQVQLNYSILNERFQHEINVFECFRNLSSGLKTSLSGIFRGDSLNHFLYCGVQKSNIELLWDTIKLRVIDGNVEEFEELNSIFMYFFNAYNSIFEKPLYELQSVNENEKFDNEKHMRTTSSRASGEVKQIVFKGYINTNSKKIERKSIVQL